MNNLSSYCGLVEAKIRAFDKDLPVQNPYFNAVLFPQITRPSTGSVKSEQATRARIKKIALDGDLLSQDGSSST